MSSPTKSKIKNIETKKKIKIKRGSNDWSNLHALFGNNVLITLKSGHRFCEFSVNQAKFEVKKLQKKIET